MKNYLFRNFGCVLVWIIAGTLGLCSCKKSYFDKKPSTNILTPKTLPECQQLLENIFVLPKTGALAQLSCDDYYYPTYQSWQATVSNTERNAYIWSKDIFGGETNRQDWNLPYKGVFYANNILKALDDIEIDSSNVLAWKSVRGWALFIRGYEFFDLVSNFSPAYDSSTASIDLGIPLKLKSGIDNIEQRSSVEKTFERILSDITEASTLLPVSVQPINRNRPSKTAAMALLGRIYLSMRKYGKAEIYADSCLQLYNALINYNTVSQTAATPFSYSSDEIIFASNMYNYGVIEYDGGGGSGISIDTILLNSYNTVNDLRYKIYFKKASPVYTYPKRGYVGGGFSPFSGLATDEIYLIKSECAARRSDTAIALAFLNNLLSKRYLTGTYVRITTSSVQETLDKILLERRKELVWRGLRWNDIKRLNKEGANIILVRVLGGSTYTINPNDPRYVFPIPDDEILLSGIPQNTR